MDLLGSRGKRRSQSIILSISCGLQERDHDRLGVCDESAMKTNFEIEIKTEFAIMTEIDFDLPIARSRSIYRLRVHDRFIDYEIEIESVHSGIP